VVRVPYTLTISGCIGRVFMMSTKKRQSGQLLLVEGG
jgi:hypothetical protein